MNSDFGFLAGVALIIFAVCAPISYCAVQRGGSTSVNDLHLACINAKGEWRQNGWLSAATCHYPESH